jgi:hypothetical protein
VEPDVQTNESPQGNQGLRAKATTMGPYRIGALDAALKYTCKHKKVWKATGLEIARRYRAQLKDGALAEKKSARKK